MKFPESWLREWVDPAISAKDLAHRLTMAGLEVESLEPVAPPFERVVVGRILTVVKHPQADRLNCLEVDVGGPEPLKIVCGAPNVAVGLGAPCALVGAVLPGGVEIRAADVRGVPSQGMMCSAKELGLAEDSSGILALGPEAVPGTSVREWLALDEFVWTLKITPNRGDCLSLRGLAREVAALCEVAVPGPAPIPLTIDDRVPTPRLVVDEALDCPRYRGRSVRLLDPRRPTPEWMRRRLERSGLRPKSLVVDVTNYMMLETGQPLHAFDQQALRGDVQVRRAREGEQLMLLDGTDATLNSDWLVIADQAGPVALAGVMGGLHSAVGDDSREIFIEAAWFDPQRIAGRARRLGIASEAAYRFERGVDPEVLEETLDRACHWLITLAGGEVGPRVAFDAPQSPFDPVSTVIRSSRVTQVLGFEMPRTTQVGILTRLGCQPSPTQEGIAVTAPSARFDLRQEIDFIEELARVFGYDQIPVTPPQAEIRLLAEPEGRRSQTEVTRILVERDYQEIITYSFVDRADEQRLALHPSTLELLNPIASQLAVMRSTLAVGLINTLRFNLDRKQDRVRLFEVGRCFEARAGGEYPQALRIGGLVQGSRWPDQWGTASKPVDFYDLKADVLALIPQGCRFEPMTTHPALHPGRAARIWWGERLLGWMGELHPALGPVYDLPSMPLLFELALAPLQQCVIPVAKAPARFQPVGRDLAVVVDEAVPAGAVEAALRSTGIDQVQAVTLFDVYRGENLPENKKSLAFRIVMQDTERTLMELDLDRIRDQMLGILQGHFDAKLR